ncbi:MAG: tRNA 2-thiocytidine(32) synthetase TtcA [Deltaproteobacteria bacterium]|nr:MAG: tRNA 2-thiocytidine(32) synthetase TtcA [Deltaproteobacteria bacterium]
MGQATLEKRLAHEMGRCIADYELIEPGDRVMVAISGGKDSYTLLHLLERARRRAPVPFEIVAVHLDQGQPGYDGTALEAWLHEQGYEHRIVRENTYRLVTKRIPEGQTYCSMCSRLRRGILYNVAESLDCTKIALGHHRDDAIETLMLNMMFNGSLSAMPAKLESDDGRNTVIRPLLYSSEQDIAAYSGQLEFPIIPCNLCGSQQNLWRQQVKQMLDDIEKRAPKVRQSMLAALKNVHTSHLLGTG